jgi:hypothetical protein
MRRVLAEGSVTRLESCGCGSLYLTVGPLTVCLHLSAVEELHRILGRALVTLGLERTGRCAHRREDA